MKSLTRQQVILNYYWKDLNAFVEIKRALKKIKKKSVIADDSFFTEYNILKGMDHPHICKLLELFQDKEHYYLVTE